MTYNMTAIGDNTTGFASFVVAVNNELMFGYLGILLLIGIAAVIFLGIYASTRELKPTLIAVTWSNLVFTLIFAALPIVQPMTIFVSIILLALAMAVPRD